MACCLASTTSPYLGFKNASDFFENHRNGSAGTESKNHWFLEFKFKIFKKIKNLEKLCKKLDQILRTWWRKLFKARPFCWIKFKLNKKCKNGPTWPTTHVYCIRSPWVSRIEDDTFPISSGWKRRQSRAEREEIGNNEVKIGEIRSGIGRLSR
jgi:hypothetical protein